MVWVDLQGFTVVVYCGHVQGSSSVVVYCGGAACGGLGWSVVVCGGPGGAVWRVGEECLCGGVPGPLR